MAQVISLQTADTEKYTRMINNNHHNHSNNTINCNNNNNNNNNSNHANNNNKNKINSNNNNNNNDDNNHCKSDAVIYSQISLINNNGFLEYFSKRPFDKFKDYLAAQFLIMSGARECGHPVLILDANALKRSKLQNNADFRDFLYSFIRLNVNDYIDTGVMVIIDLRNGGTNAGKHLIVTLKDLFPLHDIIVFTTKTGRIFSYPSSVGPIKLRYCHDIDSLMQIVLPNNIPAFMGGLLRYDHREWLQIVQLLQSNTDKAFNLIRSITKLLDVYTNTDYHDNNVVEYSPKTMSSNFNQNESIEVEYKSSISAITSFNDRLESITQDKTGLTCTPGLCDILYRIEFLRATLKDVMDDYRTFWHIYQEAMSDCVKACLIKRKIKNSTTQVLELLEQFDDSNPEYPQNFEEAIKRGKEFDDFSRTALLEVEQEMIGIERDVWYLLSKHTHDIYFENDYNELKGYYKKLTTHIHQQTCLLVEFADYFSRCKQVIIWSDNVANSLIAKNETTNHKQLLKKVNKWLEETKSTLAGRITKQAQMLPGSYVKEHHELLKAKVNAVITLLNDKKPVLEKEIASSNLLEKLKFGNKSKTASPIISPTLEEPSLPVLSTMDTNTTIASISILTGDEEKSQDILNQRRYIYKEIIDTETVYCKDLKFIIDNYINCNGSSNNYSLNPPEELTKHTDVIYSNIENLYSFHSNVFLEELKRHQSHPQNIGVSFVKQKYNFQLYSTYCKNRPKCESILSRNPEILDYFQAKQQSLEERLPFTSYLIKPIQRITKYQLLLKDMKKNSKNANEAYAYLEDAIDSMETILKNLNDTMYINAIKHFPGNAFDLGILLAQDKLKVRSPQKKKLAIRKQQYHSQQAFLFEKSLVLCKREKLTHHMNEVTQDVIYLYRHHIPTTEIILRENVPGNPLAIEILVHKQNLSYILEIPDMERRKKWIQSLNILLQLQFSKVRNKAMYETGSKAGFTSLSEAVLEKGVVERVVTLVRDNSLPEFESHARDHSDSSEGGTEDSISTTIRHMTTVKAKSRTTPFKPRPVSTGMISTQTQHSPAPKHSSDIPVISCTNSIPDAVSDHEESSSEDEENKFPASPSHRPLFEEGDNLLVGSLRTYKVFKEYKPDSANPHGIAVKAGQSVMVLGLRPNGLWWVRTLPPHPLMEGWLPQEVLNPSIPSNKNVLI